MIRAARYGRTRPAAAPWPFAIAAALAACASSEKIEPPPEEPLGDPARPPTLDDGAAHDPRSVLVRFKAPVGRSSPRAAQTRALGKVGATFVDRNRDGVYDRFPNLDRHGRLMKLDLPATTTVAEALDVLRGDPAVEYAEPNYYVRVADLPDDARFSEQHGLHNTGQLRGTPDADIDAPEAWARSIGSSQVVVGVIDTGVDYRHVDLAANLWVNPGEIAGNQLDDDGNGVIDDVHGFDARSGDGDPMDEQFHGTHCAGIAGAVGGNGLGVAGVNWNVSLMALKFLDGNGRGTVEDAIAAIDYAVAQRRAGVNLRVLSASWSGSFSLALQDAIDEAGAAEILFVAAAGNGNGSDNDRVPVYPASFPGDNIVAVAATDVNDDLAYFSNFGATSVDLGAPGYSIVSTTPGDTYQALSGTSMATPHVAGAAALLLSVDPSLTTAQLKELLLSTGDPRPALEGVTVSGRRLNLARALEAAGPPVPRFGLLAAPVRRTVEQGGAADYQLSLEAFGDFSGEVSLEVHSSPPLRAALTLAPPLVAVPGTSALHVSTTAATAPGFYTLTVVARHGALTLSRAVELRVRRSGSVTLELPSTDTPLPIPEDPRGVDSVLRVSQPLDVEFVEVELDVTHGYRGDVRVILISPSGTELVLPEASDDSGDDLHQTYVLPTEYTGEQAYGDWTLRVADVFLPDTGTLDRWTLRIFGTPSAPTFLVDAGAEHVEVAQNGTVQIPVTITALAGFQGEVTLSATTGLPFSGGRVFSPPRVIGAGATTLTLSPSCYAAPGHYAFTIRATSGAIVREARVEVTVVSFNATTIPHPSTDTPLPIPDDAAAGLSSRVEVTQDLAVERVDVEVHIKHPDNRELTLYLFGPGDDLPWWELLYDGDEEGDGGPDLHRTFSLDSFPGPYVGQWTLLVRDNVTGSLGRLDSWTLHLTGDVARSPVASFTHQIHAETRRVSFRDTSDGGTCDGSGVVGWMWSFGDGATSSVRHPSHTYASPGTYDVTLTATSFAGTPSRGRSRCLRGRRHDGAPRALAAKPPDDLPRKKELAHDQERSVLPRERRGRAGQPRARRRRMWLGRSCVAALVATPAGRGGDPSRAPSLHERLRRALGHRPLQGRAASLLAARRADRRAGEGRRLLRRSRRRRGLRPLRQPRSQRTADEGGSARARHRGGGAGRAAP